MIDSPDRGGGRTRWKENRKWKEKASQEKESRSPAMMGLRVKKSVWTLDEKRGKTGKGKKKLKRNAGERKRERDGDEDLSSLGECQGFAK